LLILTHREESRFVPDELTIRSEVQGSTVVVRLDGEVFGVFSTLGDALAAPERGSP
jgi:hypothetical protein